VHLGLKAGMTKKPGIFYGWYIVFASWLMLFLTSAVAVSIFFKPVLEEFGWDRATLSSVQTVALVVFAFISPFLGRIIDRFGPRLMLFINIGTQTFSSVINGMATGLWHLYLGRLLYEIKSSHSTQVLINRWFVRKRGRALGIVSTGMPLGTLLLSPLSQYLVLIWGWRSTLFFWAVVTFIILVPLTLLIRNSPEEKGCYPDGEVIRAGFHPEEGGVKAKFSLATGSNLSEVLRSGAFWLVAGSQFICGIGCGFMMTHIVIFTTDFGYSSMLGATLLSVQGGANLIGLLTTGYISDRKARNRVLAATHLIRSASFLSSVAFILLGGAPPFLLFLAMALFGFGWFTTSPLTSALAADLFGYSRMGTILGLILSSHMIGMAIGALGGGVVFDIMHSYFWFFLLQGALEILAALFAFLIRHPAYFHLPSRADHQLS